MIPKDTQKRSNPQRVAPTDEKTGLCTVSIIKCTVSRFKALYGIDVCNDT